MIDAEFLKVLACPYCVTRPMKEKSSLAKGTLALVTSDAGKQTGLKCLDCGRVYPIDADGIPHLIVGAAAPAK